MLKVLIKALYSFLATQFDGLFVGFQFLCSFTSYPGTALLWKGGSKGTFFFWLHNHSVLSAWWTFLINHKTMFHYLGISVSRSLLSICGLLKPAGSRPFLILEKKNEPDLHRICIYVFSATIYSTQHSVEFILCSPPVVVVPGNF